MVFNSRKLKRNRLLVLIAVKLTKDSSEYRLIHTLLGFSEWSSLQSAARKLYTMPVATAADATLELTLLSTDGLKDTNLFVKSRSLTVVWVDPSFKKSAKTPVSPSLTSTRQTLHLPLSAETLRNPVSCLTVQILSSRLPFRKPIAIGLLPLSSIPFAGDVLTLPLRRSSGRHQGSLRISIRILWCLGAAPPANLMVERSDFLSVHPTAPLMLEEQCAAIGAPTEVFPVYPTAPPMPDDYSNLSDDSTDSVFFAEEAAEILNCDQLVDQTVPALPIRPDDYSNLLDDSADSGLFVEEAAEILNCDKLVDETAQALPIRKTALRSFLVGLISGTVAAVLVGAAGFSDA